MSIGAPLLSLDRVVQDAQGRGVEYLAALYRPDMFRLEMTLSRVGAGEARHWEPVVKPAGKRPQNDRTADPVGQAVGRA